MDRLLKLILPAYLLIYFFTVFFWRSYKVWKTTRINPFVLGSTDTAHDYIGKVFKVIFALITATVIIYALSIKVYGYLMPIAWLERLGVKLIGLVLLFFSLIWTLLTQAQMGSSWRIGIDAKRKTDLVQGGVFRLSRNPIFLGMIMTLAGLFLILPNVLTLLILILGFVLIQIQVRLEEEYLTGIHGENYLEYGRRVRRWL